MNGLVTPPPARHQLTQWARNAEILVYVVPVGAISPELFASYLALLTEHAVIALRSLSRPGGYTAELSPFRSLAWHGDGCLRLRFVATTDRVDAVDGEDAHACHRPLAVLGLCHCPSTPRVPAAYAQFMAAVARFPGLLVQQCFAFEHAFEDAQAMETCAALPHLVMFPRHHALAGGGSTVSLHLQVVLDTLCVTILMSLESAVRSALRQHSHSSVLASASAASVGESVALADSTASALLDTNVEPAALNMASPMDFSPTSTFTDRAASAPRTDARTRQRRVARQRKLFGDYALLVSCVPDAMEHYLAAIELLREEERRSNGASGDTLWLAAALEAYAFCLCVQDSDGDKLVIEVVDRASEAVALYARAGVYELESMLIEHVGWYYTAVAVRQTHAAQAPTAATGVGGGVEKVEELIWTKRLLWELLERGRDTRLMDAVRDTRRTNFLIQAARMLEAVGHRRRMALFLHEAVSLLIRKHHRATGNLRDATGGDMGGLSPIAMVLSPPSSSPVGHATQRSKDLRAALHLEQVTAFRLGMVSHNDTSVSYWNMQRPDWGRSRIRRRRRGEDKTVTMADTAAVVVPWLVLRFHVIRQLLVLAKLLAEPVMVGTYCTHLLHLLAWFDEMIETARPSTTPTTVSLTAVQLLDQPQAPFSCLPRSSSCDGVDSSGSKRGSGSALHAQSGVFFAPPPTIDIKPKSNGSFYFTSSPSTAASSAVAAWSSTLASTPRLLATPRQQLSAAVNAISTKTHFSTTSTSSGHRARRASASASDMGDPSTLPGFSSEQGTSRRSGSGGSNGANESALLSVALGIDSDEHVVAPLTINVDPLDTGTPAAEIQPAWDLRSRDQLHSLQKRLLNVLEMECAMLRQSDQTKLETFIQVHKMRIISRRRRGDSPFLTRERALQRYSCGSAGPNDEAEVESPAFFYNPFEKKNLPKKRNTGGHGTVDGGNYGAGSDEDEHTDSSDDEQTIGDGNMLPRMNEYERGHPVHERMDVAVSLSNPLGISIELQQVSVWATEFLESSSGVSASATSTTLAMLETYPSAIVLPPYTRRRRVVLSLRPLQRGRYTIRGCFVKVVNVKMCCRLDKPVTFDVVDALPLLAASVADLGGSLSVTDGMKLSVPLTDSSSSGDHSGESRDMQLCMYASEKKRCVLHLRNIGREPIRSLRIHAELRRQTHAPGRTVDSLKPLRMTLFSNLTVDSSQERHQVESEEVSVVCHIDRSTIESYLPLERGDRLVLPFDIELHSYAGFLSDSRRKGSHSEAVIQHLLDREWRDHLEWTLTYSSHSENDMEELCLNSKHLASVDLQVEQDTPLPASVFFRDSFLGVKLVSLPSLVLTSVDVLPSGAEYSATLVSGGNFSGHPVTCILDNSHCVVVIEVTNPTETAFWIRMRLASNPDVDMVVNEPDKLIEAHTGLERNEWDLEIGRQCARRLAIVVPRIACTHEDRCDGVCDYGVVATPVQLAGRLNGLIDIRWATHFGTAGRLPVHPHIWTEKQSEWIGRQLAQSPLKIEISGVDRSPSVNEDIADSRGLSGHETTQQYWTGQPFCFYQGARRHDPPRIIRAQLFEPLELIVRVSLLRESTHSTMESVVIKDTRSDIMHTSANGGHKEVEVGVIFGRSGDPLDENAMGSSTPKDVLVSGTLQKTMLLTTREHDATTKLPVRCLFLSEGCFLATVRVRGTRGGDIWSHSPLIIKVDS